MSKPPPGAKLKGPTPEQRTQTALDSLWAALNREYTLEERAEANENVAEFRRLCNSAKPTTKGTP